MFGSRGARGWLAFGVIAVASACTALDGLSGDDAPEPTPELPGRVTACAADNAPNCGAHGTCVEADAGATCACAERYAGPTCSSCAPGFQDGDGDGTCDLVCGSVTCAAHQLCDVASGTPTCVCAPGYAPESGACTWKGLLQDPGFQNTPPGAWSLDGGASIDATAAAAVSPGVAIVPKASCTTARIRQSFGMPTVAEGEPLAIDVSSQIKCAPTPPGLPGGIVFPCVGFPFQIGFRGRWQTGFISAGTAPPPATDHVCLGERAFGGTLDLALGGDCGFFVAEDRIDHAVIVSAPECPLPGKIANGNFEGTGGWKANGTTAEIAATGGNGGSRAGHLFTSKLCDTASLLGTLSSPTSIPHPALVMTVKGTTSKTMTVALGYGGVIGTVTGTNVFDKVSICLPEWSRGLAMPLSFGTSQASTGTCGDPGEPTDFLFDDLSVVSDPACADPGWVVDPGFELAGPWKPWVPGAGVSFPRNAAAAHGGTGFLALSTTGSNGTCGSVSSSQYVTVPDANPAGGPFVRFWYKTSAAGTPTLDLAGVGSVLTPSPGGWTESRRCIDPSLAGTRMYATWNVSGTGSCTSATMYVDDVELGYDPACPK